LKVSDDPHIDLALRRLYDDTPLFCEKVLQIRDMQGRLVPLRLNRAQLHAHALMEEQRRRIGMVRALVLKGRKQGLSTYVGGRFYHRVSMREGLAARVLAHKMDSSDDLFGIVRRYQDNNWLHPKTETSSAKELSFADTDSHYKVQTAGSEDIGRGGTAQFLHASEFAFWRNANEQLAAIGNVVADVPGTEIVLESTANGQGNAYHNLWQAAEAGESQYIPIFVPWFWEDRYVAPVAEDFELDDFERDYAAAYGGLSLAQMAWRRNKIREYGRGYEWLFDQEFPACPSLAFVTSTTDPLIPPTLVSAAVNSGYNVRQGPLVIGCDPAEMGEDRTVIVFRQGRVVFRTEIYVRRETMEVAGMLVRYWQDFQPDAIFVDKIGIGAGIVSRMKELGCPVIGVNSAERATDSELYHNKRAEMWHLMKAWLEDQPCRLPDEPQLIADLSAPAVVLPDSSGRRILEKKDHMKKRGVRSPDCADALALTFAEPVVARADQHGHDGYPGHAPASRAGY
jgi:hypothetical protein